MSNTDNLIVRRALANARRALRPPRHGETLRAMCNLYSITNLSLRRPQGRTATRRREAPREQEPKRQLMKGALRIQSNVHASSELSDICVPIMPRRIVGAVTTMASKKTVTVENLAALGSDPWPASSWLSPRRGLSSNGTENLHTR